MNAQHKMEEMAGQSTANQALTYHRTEFQPDPLLCRRNCITFPKVDDFFNIVHQAIEHPLDVNFYTTTQGEPSHILVCPNVAENGFHDPYPFAVKIPINYSIVSFQYANRMETHSKPILKPNPKLNVRGRAKDWAAICDI